MVPENKCTHTHTRSFCFIFVDSTKKRQEKTCTLFWHTQLNFDDGNRKICQPMLFLHLHRRVEKKNEKNQNGQNSASAVLVYGFYVQENCELLLHLLNICDDIMCCKNLMDSRANVIVFMAFGPFLLNYIFKLVKLWLKVLINAIILLRMSVSKLANVLQCKSNDAYMSIQCITLLLSWSYHVVPSV